VTDNLPENNRRWHDNRGDLSKTVELLESIPEEVRPHISAALTDKANQDFNAAEILRSLKSLGPEKIMMLHQARNKRRAYDQDADLQKIVTTFFILPEDAQDTLARDFLVFIELMVEYMANCDSFELEPKESELVQMRDLFVHSGAEAVRAYLNQVHQEYYKLLDSESEIAREAKSTLVQGEQGMRIRGILPE
jgi:hypothetical protein